LPFDIITRESRSLDKQGYTPQEQDKKKQVVTNILFLEAHQILIYGFTFH
jgi:hypothetical protein